MRRAAAFIAAALIAAALALLCLSCGKKEEDIAFSSPDEVLLSSNGEALVCAGDFYLAKALFGKNDEEVFIELAETALAARFAEEYGAEGLDVKSAEITAVELAEESAATAGAKEVMDELGLSEERFKELYTRRALNAIEAEAIVKDIASIYTRVADASEIEEHIMENLKELASFEKIKTAFPGLEDMSYDFESVVR